MPAELGRHGSWVEAVEALGDERVVTGGHDERVLAWDPAHSDSEVLQLNCSVNALAVTSLDAGRKYLAIAHKGNGFSVWLITDDTAR